MGVNDMWPWWKDGVIYQIYPRSFRDSNGDGVGDIPGIIQMLDYLEWLGVDAMWLSPINTSPMYDFGYDISDYRGIDPLFGTLEDFDRLIAEAHRRGIRVILDMVVNHTSHLHPWFIESRSSRDNPKRDWYIWHDGKNGRPPNNWRAVFGGRAWEWDERTRQYYYHSFLKEQPDLNWRNPQLREAVFDEMRYWLDRGVDGFRLDAVSWYIKDELFRDNPCGWGPNAPRPYDLQKHVYDQNRPETHEVLRRMRSLFDGYPERMMVGETYAEPPGDPTIAASYYGDGTDELHLAFDFSTIFIPFRADAFRRCLSRWYEAVPPKGWPCIVFNNHDQVRSVSRWRPGRDAAKAVATILLAARGTPFLYYGEEIGMRNGRIKRREMCDPLGKRYWPFNKGRDPERTPMQWSDEPNAGFSDASPWLPVNDDYRDVNVACQREDPASILHYYRALIQLRRSRPPLRRGSIEWIDADEDLVSFTREYEGERIFVAVNCSRKAKRIRLAPHPLRVLLGSHGETGGEMAGDSVALAPYGALVLEKIFQ